MKKFKGFKNFEIMSEYKNLTLIREFEASRKVCVSMCRLDCSCKIAEWKTDTCQLFNETAVHYLVMKIEKDDEFIYFEER